jgi:thiol-disulfide isomerase/thioredoxin
MFKKLFLILLLSVASFAYDFGAVPKVSVADIPLGKPTMIQFGKTECVWCEHMAPYFKDIKAEYPKTPIYYVNTDLDVVGMIKYNVIVLPLSVFLDADGKEVGRVEGYLMPDKIMALLETYEVLVK